MRYLLTVFLTTTTLLASPGLPTAYEAHPNDARPESCMKAEGRGLQ
jgi:hypothetical protein